MAKNARTSSGDHSFMSSLYKPVVSYAKNVTTQVGQAGAAAAKSLVAGYTPASKGSKKEAQLKAASANARKQAGQAIGAITQNKKYKD